MFSSCRSATAPSTKEVGHGNELSTASTALEAFFQHILDQALDKEFDEKLDEKFEASQALKDYIPKARAATRIDLDAELSAKIKTDLRSEMTTLKTELEERLRTGLSAKLDTGSNELSAEMKEMTQSFAELKEDFNLVVKMVQVNDSQVKALTDKVAFLEAQIKKPFASYPRC